MRKRIVIIGGGASGLTAAIGGARNGAHVTIVEHMDRVGKKILSTGNGRCNLTNLRMEADCYRCGRKEFPMEVIRGFGVDETLAFFKGLGIEPKDRNGYIYPNSGPGVGCVRRAPQRGGAAGRGGASFVPCGEDRAGGRRRSRLL